MRRAATISNIIVNIKSVAKTEGEYMDFSNISPELREQARACKSTEELVALAESEGINLSDEQLDAISGGFDWSCSDAQAYEP